MLLSGCAGSRPASIAGGECRIAHTPQYAVKGATPYDQNWVDDTTESLVAGCKQPRPLARPASLDVPTHKVGGKPVVVPVTTKKRHFWQRG
jgi:hypothetical protein